MHGSFQARNATIQEILFSNLKFRIPRYQRPYAWGEDQVSEFWNDLNASEEPFFLGSLILNYGTLNETGYIEIIDGQQRLLTITILSAVLRDIAQTIDPSTADRYQRQDIAIEDRDGNQDFRILPGDTTQKFFKEYIQKEQPTKSIEPATKEEQRIQKNYQFLYQRVISEINRFNSNQEKLSYLNSLRRKVSDLVVIHIQIESEESAYEIFETTNARGVDLSVSDLIKNLIFRKIPPRDSHDFAKEVWQEIIANTETAETELKKFIRYFWISRYAFVTEKRLFKAVKIKIKDWNQLLQDLWDDSELFLRLKKGERGEFNDLKHGSRIFRSIFAIRLMNVSQCYVLFLALLRNFEKLETDPTRVFETIEKFTFQYSVISKLPGNKVERLYAHAAIKIENAVQKPLAKHRKAEVQRILAELENDLKKELPPWELFRKSFMELSYRSSKKRKILKYILAKIDAYYRSTDEEVINFDTVNIEHILPRNPKAWGLNKKDTKSYVDKLGNLTLLSTKINSKLQNKPLPEKMELLRKSSLPITKELVRMIEDNNLQWGEQQIIQRQEEMAKLAYEKIWKL